MYAYTDSYSNTGWDSTPVGHTTIYKDAPIYRYMYWNISTETLEMGNIFKNHVSEKENGKNAWQ